MSSNRSGMPNTSALYEKLNRMQIRGSDIPTPPSPVIQSGTGDSASVPRGLEPRRDMRLGLGLGLTFDHRPPPTLPITPPSSNGKSGRGMFDLEAFKPEVRVDGQTYPVSQSDFENIRHLGEGACGNVQLMRHKQTGVSMAIKKMRRTQDLKEQRRIFTDLNIVIKEHTCPNIINSFGAFITEQDVCICMEPMDTCLDKLQRALRAKGVQGPGSIPENVLGKITVGVVHGLDFLKREYSVIHRDVKPSNILIDRHGEVKICDFGIAGNLVDSKVKTRDQGCPAYMSPERIDPPDQDNPSYDIRADVWSLGITLVELAYCKYPYNHTSVQFMLMTEIINEPAPRLDPKDQFSPEFTDFVSIILVKDVTVRPKYDKLLQHAFVKKYEKINKNVVANWYSSNFLDEDN